MAQPIKTLDELSKYKQRLALKHFRLAVAARLSQWDHETVIEGIFGELMELCIADVAATCDNPADITLKELRDWLEGSTD